MFVLKNLNIKAKRSKLVLNCESSEAKRTCSIVEKIISKRSELVYIEEFGYRSEANRFDSYFVFKKTKKNELSFFFKTKSKKRKRSIVNYRSFAITKTEHVFGEMRKFFRKGAHSFWKKHKMCFGKSAKIFEKTPKAKLEIIMAVQKRQNNLISIRG
jgi:hypothetical protein